jgi:putative ABC transport system permease protein
MLVFVQLGLSEAVLKNATVIYDALNFDVVLVSPNYVSIWKAGRLPRTRLHQALAVPGVEEASPLYLNFLPWRNTATGGRRDIFMIGCDPRRQFFRLPEVRLLARELQRSDTVLVDRLTRPEFGPRMIGGAGEVAGRRVELIGEYTLGAGFYADATLIGSDETFVRLLRRHPVEEVNLGLVRLRAGADPEAVARELGRRLPDDVRAWSRRTLETHERDYWNRVSAVGVIFGVGTVVGFAVLTVIAYQLVSTDITKRLREYATMKAIGHTHGALVRVVLQHALILTGLAVTVGFLLTLPVYALLVRATYLPVSMTIGRGVGVVVLAVALAIASSLLAIRRLRSADPADLF